MSKAAPAMQADAGEPRTSSAADAGSSPQAHAEVDLDTLVAAWLTEYEHEVQATCPCRVEQHSFPSVQDCVRQFGDALGVVDCASESLAPADSPSLRASLRCAVESFARRANCLETHSCDPTDMNDCYVPDDCPPLDGQAFTPVFYNCLNGTKPPP